MWRRMKPRMPAATAFWPPVSSTWTSKCSSLPPRRSAKSRASATPEALSFSPPLVPASAMSISRAMATISSTVGMNCATVNATPLTPARRSRQHSEHRHRGPEERLERADRAVDQPPERCPALLSPGAHGEPAAPGVVVGDEHQQSRLVAVPPRDDVLRGAAPEQATHGRQQQARVEEQQQRTDECEHGADHRDRDREHAAQDAEGGEDRVGERPVGPDVDRLALDVAPEARQALLEVARGSPLGVAAGGAPPGFDERVDFRERVHSQPVSPVRASTAGKRVECPSAWSHPDRAPASSWPEPAASCSCW